MKKKLMILVVVALLMIFTVSTGCKKKFVWNPVGGWLVEVNHDTWGLWSENITLTGNEDGGSISGWEKFNPSSTLGTWTKTGDYTISIRLNYVNSLWTNDIELTGTTTKDSPNIVTLTGVWTETGGFMGTLEYMMTATAHKTSGLQ